jgi:MFS transporter, OFA family, oxalate/formate antiporter
MMTARPKNRWLIAASAVGIHICIGSVYAFSVLKLPVSDSTGWTALEVMYAFSVAIFFLGISAAFLGWMVEKKGPRYSGRLSAICFTLGTLGTGLAFSTGSYWLFIASFGVLGGIGLGLGYISPVSSLMKWFPDRRGLATGFAIMGFGLASVVFGPLMAHLVTIIDISTTFYVLAGIFFVLMFISASYLAPPPEGWEPNKNADSESKKGVLDSGQIKKLKKREDLANLKALDALKTRRFYLIWLMLFLNVSCGIGIIADTSPMAQEIIGLTPEQAALLVGLKGLFNGLGRIGWSSLSDVIGRPATYASFFVIESIAFFWLAQGTGTLEFQILFYLVLTCYGGGFATVPAFLGDLFGTKEVGTIHGYLLTAWAAAGVAGPIIHQWVRDVTGSYSAGLQIFAGAFVIALAVTGLLYLNMRKIRAQNEAASGIA